MRKFYFLLLVILSTKFSFGQMLIPNTSPQTQNFDGMGNSGTATLPTGFKVDQGINYGTGTTATTLAYGTSGTGAVTGSSTGGTINWANGVTASSTDRALGFLSTGTFTSPRNIMLQLQNTTGQTITSLSVSFDYEKYRTGTRAWDMNFFSSTDGSSWTAQTSGDQNYVADGANAVVNPPTTISKSLNISGLSIANNGFYYLRWSYTGSGGSTNSQGLGVDNLSITASTSGPAGTSTITAGPGSEPLTISSLVNTQGAASLNFDFTITDDGATPGTDVLTTQISQIVLNAGTGNAVVNWFTALAGVELSDGTNSTTSATIGTSSITFSGITNTPGTLGYIADDASKTYTLKIWLNTNLGALKTTIDGQDFVFRIQNSDITVTGSQFATAQDVNSGDGNNTVDVTATALAFVQGPSNATVNAVMSPAVTISANDANGNRDLGSAVSVDITSTGTLSGSPVSATAVNGLASFNTLTHTVIGNGFTLNAERTGTLDWDITSTSFNIVDIVGVGEVLINQMSPDYNGASDEYVELVNTTNKSIDLSGLTLKYQSSSGGAGGAGGPLSGTLPPHGYWLLSPNATITIGLTNLSRDGVITAGFASAAGQIGLVRNADNVVVDAVGWGTLTGGNYSEGTAAVAPPTDGGLKRVTDGVDNNANSTDFTTVTQANIDLRNNNSRLANIGASIDAGSYSRMYVTGDASLGGTVSLSEKLVFISGSLSLGSNDLTITNNSPTNSITGNSSSSYVKTNGTGSLKRAVSGAGTYVFPVGSNFNLEEASVDFAAPLGAANTLAARFISGSPGASGLPLVETGDNINGISKGGYWQITAASAFTDAYTGTFMAKNFPDFLDYTKLHLLKRADGSSPWTLDGTHVPASGSNALATLQRTGMSGFSQFGVGGQTNGALPVSLISFSGYKDGTRNQLRWTTANEQNNRGFDIQRSADGVNYSSIGFINTQAVGGTSSDMLNYAFTDLSPAGSRQYYRLRQEDIDGRSKLSNIVLIRGDKPVSLSIDGLFPNPANTVVNVLIAAPGRDQVKVIITDMAGRTMLQKQVSVETGANTVPVDISKLTNGTYLVKLVCTDDCETVTGKFVKQ